MLYRLRPVIFAISVIFFITVINIVTIVNYIQLTAIITSIMNTVNVPIPILNIRRKKVNGYVLRLWNGHIYILYF